MAVSTSNVGSYSLGSPDDDLGLFAASYFAGVFGGYGHMTRVAAPGTVAVDESRQIALTPVNIQVDAAPMPTVVTGA